MKTKFIILLIICQYSLFAFQFSSKNLIGQPRSLNVFFAHSALLSIGTHENNAGWQGYLQFSPRSPQLDSPISFSNHSRLSAMPHNHFLLRLSPQVHLSGLGIPGPSISVESGLHYIYSFGKKEYFDYLKNPAFVKSKTHNLGFTINSYLTTDGTSQFTGTLYYEHLRENWLLGIEFENDVFIPINDKYRTAALEFRYGYRCKGLHKRQTTSAIADNETSNADLSSHLLSSSSWLIFATGILLWTGERRVSREQFNRDAIIPLFYGREYSHGIVYVSVSFKDVKIALGYDSDQIRSAVQNGVHYLIHDGQIPSIDREDRWYVQVKWRDLGTLY